MLYKDLVVWQKAHALTLKTIKAVNHVDRSYASEVVVRQLLRAVTSIGANIAEGYGRHEGKEYTRFLEIAYGPDFVGMPIDRHSANEVDNWLNVLNDAKLMNQAIASELLKDNEEVLKILITMIRRIRGKGGENRERNKNEQ